MDPSLIAALLPYIQQGIPFLKNLLGGSGSGAPMGAISQPTQQYMGAMGAMPQLSQLAGAAEPAAVAQAQIPSSPASPAGTGNLGKLQDYTALMKAIKDIDPGMDSEPPKLGAFRFSSQGMQSQPWAQPPGMQRQQPVSSVGAYLASPAGQQILAQLRAMSQGQY